MFAALKHMPTYTRILTLINMIIGYKHLVCLVWFVLRDDCINLSPLFSILHFLSFSSRVILEKLICKAWIIQSVPPFAAKRLARAAPAKRSGMNLNNETQGRRRKLLCCSFWYPYHLRSVWVTNDMKLLFTFIVITCSFFRTGSFLKVPYSGTSNICKEIAHTKSNLI
jgi:hypothetical protein